MNRRLGWKQAHVGEKHGDSDTYMWSVILNHSGQRIAVKDSELPEACRHAGARLWARIETGQAPIFEARG